MGKIIHKQIIYGGSAGGSDVWEGTKAEYETEKDSIPADTLILITDDITPVGEMSAASVKYDNTESKMEAENAQDAIDELNNDINSLNDNLASISNWVKIGEVSGAKSVSIDSDKYSEFHITQGYATLELNYDIISAQLTTTLKETHTGCSSSSYSINAVITYNKSAITNATLLVNNTNNVAGSTMVVYGKPKL